MMSEVVAQSYSKNIEKIRNDFRTLPNIYNGFFWQKFFFD